jgi:hypothetical protein
MQLDNAHSHKLVNSTPRRDFQCLGQLLHPMELEHPLLELDLDLDKALERNLITTFRLAWLNSVLEHWINETLLNIKQTHRHDKQGPELLEVLSD